MQYITLYSIKVPSVRRRLWRKAQTSWCNDIISWSERVKVYIIKIHSDVSLGLKFERLSLWSQQEWRLQIHFKVLIVISRCVCVCVCVSLVFSLYLLLSLSLFLSLSASSGLHLILSSLFFLSVSLLCLLFLLFLLFLAAATFWPLS